MQVVNPLRKLNARLLVYTWALKQAFVHYLYTSERRVPALPKLPKFARVDTIGQRFPAYFLETTESRVCQHLASEQAYPARMVRATHYERTQTSSMGRLFEFARSGTLSTQRTSASARCSLTRASRSSGRPALLAPPFTALATCRAGGGGFGPPSGSLRPAPLRSVAGGAS